MTTVLYTVEPSRYTNAMRFAFLFAARVENLNGRRPQARDIARLTKKTILKKFAYDNNQQPHVDDFWHMACHLRDCGLLAPWRPYTENGIAHVTAKGVRWLMTYAPDLTKSIEELGRFKQSSCCHACDSHSCCNCDMDSVEIPW